MMQLIAAPYYSAFADDLAEMHRLRFRVFKQRLAWDVGAEGDLEIDAFDALCPAYLLQRSTDGRINGCVRLLPSTGPTMLRVHFPELLGGQAAPSTPAIWESSRFALDLSHDVPREPGALSPGTYELFAGMIEFGLARRLTDIVTVTDVRVERILRRASWPLRRIGPPLRIGATTSVAGYLDISPESLARVRAAGALTGPVLWMPFVFVADMGWTWSADQEADCQGPSHGSRGPFAKPGSDPE